MVLSLNQTKRKKLDPAVENRETEGRRRSGVKNLKQGKTTNQPERQGGKSSDCISFILSNSK